MANLAGQSEAFSIPFDQHPMCDEKSMIATDALELSVNRIISLLRGRQTGVGFFAVPRTGKTHMMDYFIDHHPEFLGEQIPCVQFLMWSTEGEPKATRRSFYTELLRVLGAVPRNRSTAAEKFGDVISLLVNIVKALNSNRLLLFVDEAQQLRSSELSYLADIFNELRRLNIRLKTVLIGQPTLVQRRAELKRKPEFIQRFMPRLHRMDGVIESSSLQRILRAIDDETEFPEGSTCTYTQFFVPKAYANGFRLQSYTNEIWAELTAAGRTCGIEESTGYTMQTVMEYVAEIMQELAQVDEPDLTLSASLLKALAADAALTQYVNSDS